SAGKDAIVVGRDQPSVAKAAAIAEIDAEAVLSGAFDRPEIGQRAAGAETDASAAGVAAACTVDCAVIGYRAAAAGDRNTVLVSYNQPGHRAACAVFDAAAGVELNGTRAAGGAVAGDRAVIRYRSTREQLDRKPGRRHLGGDDRAEIGDGAGAAFKADHDRAVVGLDQ